MDYKKYFANGMAKKTRAALLVTLLSVGIVLAGCGGFLGGGGGGGSLPAAGTVTFTRTSNAGATLVEIENPTRTIKVSIPPGAMTPDAPVKLDIWSEQRDLVQVPNYNPSPVAIDLTLAPADLGTQCIFIEMDGPGGDDLTTVLAAFSANGQKIVLPSTDDSTTTRLKSKLTAEILAFLGNTTATSTTPITIQIVVENATVSMAKTTYVSTQKPTLTRVWTAPESRTTYAGKKRIAITIHGILNTPADIVDLTNFFKDEKRTDGLPTVNSVPFDAVDEFDYDWKQPIQLSGQQFAAAINAKYADKTKYEVHIYAHSMGGLVTRFAVERNNTQAVTDVVTFGTPHLGVPAAVIKNVVFVISPIAVGGFTSFAAGVNQLIEKSDAITQLGNNIIDPSVTYHAVGGTASDLALGGVTVGYGNHAIFAAQGYPVDDGIVPLTSAHGGPAAGVISVAYNHGALVGADVRTYWPNNVSTNWIGGMNRKIKQLSIPLPFISMATSESVNVEVLAYDFESNKLDAGVIFDPLGGTKQVPLNWTVDDPTIVTVSNKDKLTATFTGIKTGTTDVRVTDPSTNTTTSIQVRVGETGVGIVPATFAINIRQNKQFVAQPVGTVPTGSTYRWKLTGPGTLYSGVNGDIGYTGGSLVTELTTTGPFMFYHCVSVPADGIAVPATLEVKLFDPSGTLLGTKTSSITVGGQPFIILQQGTKKYQAATDITTFIDRTTISGVAVDTYATLYGPSGGYLFDLRVTTARNDPLASGMFFKTRSIGGVGNLNYFIRPFPALDGSQTNNAGGATITTIRTRPDGKKMVAFTLDLPYSLSSGAATDPLTGNGVFIENP